MIEAKWKNTKTLSICSLPVSLVREDPGEWVDNGMGRSLLKDGKILVNSSMPDDTQLWTIVHESLHHIDDMNGLDLSEQVISTMATGVFDFIKQNPEIIKGIIDL